MKLYLNNLGEALIFMVCMTVSFALMIGVLWLLMMLCSYSILLGLLAIALVFAMIIAAVNTFDES